MRQSTLLEYGLNVLTVYVPRRNYPYKRRRGLSELQLRKRLEQKGWMVWRGGFFHALAAELYPNVRKRYNFLKELIIERKGEHAFDYLCYLCSVHHGMPDLLCYNPITKEFKFVECKLGHEQLSPRQVETIHKLHEQGFQVEVHKLVEMCTKTRKALVNLDSKTKNVIEKEMTLSAYRKPYKRQP